MEKLNLSPPWEIFVKELRALFEDDPAIQISYHADKQVIMLFVDGAEKADALTQLLPTEKSFGSVTVKIKVIPANRLGDQKAQLFQKAFEGNPALSHIDTITDVFSTPINYVVFRKEVVQFFVDDLGAMGGFRSTLYQDIAKHVFGEIPGVFFCTDIDFEDEE